MQNSEKPIFLQIKAAALVVGVPYRVLLDAVNDGTVAHYKLGSSRKLVRVDEVLEAMEPKTEGE